MSLPSLTTCLTVGLALAVPGAMLWLAPRLRVVRVLDPVILCYGLGLLLANLPVRTVAPEVSLATAQTAVGLAIPLLLFGLDLGRWWRLARPTIVSFAVCLGSVVVAALLTGMLFAGLVDPVGPIAGMLVGVYSGGTPNLAAIGMALGVSAETFVVVNAADVLVGASYLLLLLTIAPRLVARWLPAFKTTGSPAAATDDAAASWRGRGLALLLALGILGLAWLAGRAGGAHSADVITILALTTSAILASLFAAVRRLPARALGHYGLLIFCFGIGTTADFAGLARNALPVLSMVATTVALAVLLHLVLARWLGLDRDTVLITSTAAIFGPAFVPAVAAALGNREIVFSGIATGLVGYAVGNFLGLAVAWVLT